MVDKKINMIVGDGYATKCVLGSKTWFNIGKLLFYIFYGDRRGYEIWLEYSKYSPDYDEKYCYELWSDFDELMPEDFSEEDYGYALL